jgi:ribosomal protein S18 acetylase RimI-like enzyme
MQTLRLEAEVDFRTLCEQDLELIGRHREEMFRDAGIAEEVLSAMKPHFQAWLGPKLRDGSYFGFLACDESRPVGGIGLLLLDWPPHHFHPTSDKRGYVLNLFVEPAYRRRGLASKLMLLAEIEFANRGISFAVLHASAKGMPLYSELGWTRTSEMSKSMEKVQDTAAVGFES